jgi:hypothetical protein
MGLMRAVDSKWQDRDLLKSHKEEARAMGQKITTTQFYLYGRKHFTRTGWQSAFQGYASEGLPDCDLSGKVFAVTGANSGIGKELSQFLSSKNGKVYMVWPLRPPAPVLE